MRRPEFVRLRTRRDTQRRIFILVAALGSAQFVLNALSIVLEPRLMVALWLSAAFLVGLGSILFEIYKAKQARW